MVELEIVGLAVAADGEFQPFRQRVDHGHADAVQAAGDLVGIAVELAAGMQHRHHDLGRGPVFLVVGMDVGRYAAAVVDDADGIVAVDDDLDLVAMSGQRLVDGVVHHLEDHVMQAGTVARVADVHARALAHRLEALEHLDALGVVFVVAFHAKFSSPESRCASASRRT